ncbi:MAG: carboxynorspermidine decarboxylase [Bacteroidaceae bacterium]|nr:carboxynorspermidine decarboxylase [Bacteroidaceae bacterium]
MTPYYILHENLLRRNLSLIRSIMDVAGVEFILAFKAYALWRTFPIFREYISATTASSPDEARLAYEEFGSKAHTYSPAYEPETFRDVVACSSHITFNSLTQLQRFGRQAREAGVSLGLRINPEHSEVETEIYNPCAPGSRFGVTADVLAANEHVLEQLDGLHCHCHCESSSYELERTLAVIEEKFGRWLDRIKWLNLGGGHLVSRKDYDVDHLIGLLRAFRERHPHLHVILEPGSAFAWQTGELVANVVDVVENHGIRTAILNVSFTCHMPDCLEMPYYPVVRGAEHVEEGDSGCSGSPDEGYIYRLGGNSCLSGDWMAAWRFDHELEVGEEIVFEDMIHYTTVKTCTFNGIHHPSLVIERQDGSRELLRRYTYEDYRDRMD